MKELVESAECNKWIHEKVKWLRRYEDPVAYEAFRADIIANIDAIIRNGNTRWLISICDTIVDQSPDPTERAVAMIISVLFNMEKLSFTSQSDLNKEAPADRHFYDGTTKFVKGGDMVANMGGRLGRCVEPYPYLERILEYVVTTMGNCEKTSLGKLNRDIKNCYWCKAKMPSKPKTVLEGMLMGIKRRRSFRTFMLPPGTPLPRVVRRPNKT